MERVLRFWSNFISAFLKAEFRFLFLSTDYLSETLEKSVGV